MPLVTALTGRSGSALPGQIGAHILLVTCLCRRLTVLTPPDVRNASAVMLKSGPPPLS